MKYFCKFIVIDKPELELGYPLTNLSFSDYRDWGLFSFDEDKILVYGDNVHNNGIASEIEAFINGVKFAGEEVNVMTGAVMVKDATIGVDKKDILPLLIERNIIGGEL